MALVTDQHYVQYWLSGLTDKTLDMIENDNETMTFIVSMSRLDELLKELSASPRVGE